MPNKVFYDAEARRKLLGGAEILYQAVKTVLGPRGRNVVIGSAYGTPRVTHDGVTVAKSVEIEELDDDTLGYRIGAELIKEAASKMNDTAGDGTTTVTVLTYHILNEANKLIAAGYDPVFLKKGLEKASEEVLKALESISEPISEDEKRIRQIATISAGDKILGELIADVMYQVGSNGVVTVEESQGLEVESTIVEGFTFDRGFVSPYLVTDSTKMEAVFENPTIVITDKKISEVEDISGLLEKLVKAGKKQMVLIANEVEGDALSMLILNKVQEVIETVAVKAPGFGPKKKEYLEDLAVLTGGKVLGDNEAVNFNTATVEDLGSANKIIVNKESTTIVGGSGAPTELQARTLQINEQIKSALTEHEKSQLEKRRAALSGKVGVIKIGGSSDTEIGHKKDRVDDAVAAVKAAMKDGIVPGGAVTLINLSCLISKLDDQEENAGAQLLVRALREPFKILMKNSGLNPDELLPVILSSKNGYGVNVQNPSVIVDLKKEGVIDPALVTRKAIQNAVSVAGTGMTMGVLITPIPEKIESSQSV